MVLGAYGTNVSTSRVVSQAFGEFINVANFLHGTSNSVDRVIHAFNSSIVPYGQSYSGGSIRRLHMYEIVDDIDLRRPIIANRVEKGSNVGHMVVIKGYEDIGGYDFFGRPTTGDILIIDPETGRERKVSHAGFVESATHLCNSSLRMTAPALSVFAPPAWLNEIRNAPSDAIITVPGGNFVVDSDVKVPETSKNVTIQFQPNTQIHFTANANMIWAGASGSIEGADNLSLNPEITVYGAPEPQSGGNGISPSNASASPESQPKGKIIGLFSDLGEAIYYGRDGKTVVVGPGIYNYRYEIGGQTVIGTIGPAAPKDPTRSTIFRMGFDNSTSGKVYPPAEVPSDAVTLIKGWQLEINGDAYGQDRYPTLVYGEDNTVFEDCVFEAVYSDPTNKNVNAFQLGAENYPLTGQVKFINSTFRNFGTAIYVNHPMLPEQSPLFEKCIFENNDTDLKFNEGSQALCGLDFNQMKSVLVGQQRYTDYAGINSLINNNCGNYSAAPVQNFSFADPDFVDPLASDFRLTNTSPMRTAGTDSKDIGPLSRNAVFTFSRFLDGRIEFGNNQMVQFENGSLTVNTVGTAAAFISRYALNLRPVYELTFRGDFINRPSTVTVWKNPKVPAPSLPNEYAVWDASVNGVQFAKLSNAELPSSGTVSKNAVPKIIAPAPVSGFNIVQNGGDVVLSWNRNTEPDMLRYKVFRAPAAAPDLVTQIASLPADVTQYRDTNQTATNNAYRIVAYDSTGNMSAYVGGNKLYSFSGFDAMMRDTIRVTPTGVTVLINNPNYLHGAMITVRNRGHNDSLIVDWYGSIDQNSPDCQSRSRNLFGNGAQINNFTSPKLGNGTVLINIRSATRESYLADIEIFNWRNGPGCR